MAGSSAQIRQIVDKLVEKTTKSELRWSEGFGFGAISTRLADYQVVLSRPFVGADVEMAVSDITNNETVTIGGLTPKSASTQFLGQGINRNDQISLNKLFDDITSESQTLDGLLRALG